MASGSKKATVFVHCEVKQCLFLFNRSNSFFQRRNGKNQSCVMFVPFVEMFLVGKNPAGEPVPTRPRFCSEYELAVGVVRHWLFMGPRTQAPNCPTAFLDMELESPASPNCAASEIGTALALHGVGSFIARSLSPTAIPS